MKKLLASLGALIVLSGCGAHEPLLTKEETFAAVFAKMFKDDFGFEPPEVLVDSANDAGQEVCELFDKGASADDIALVMLEESEGDEDTLKVFSMAAAAGITVYCPEYKDKL